ncbi:MAG: polysaccharide deacetylase family protein [Firmicutes bacterium]|nr:polysaccharide deacetylase family protein [Bacillota bacterium]
MRIIFFNQKKLRLVLFTTIILVMTIGVLINRGPILRRAYGVKSGVKLEGRLVQGMLPKELTELIRTWAVKINRAPINAAYFPETGEIIPAQPGRNVNVAETVYQVCLAPPGSELKLLIAETSPQITDAYFKPVYHGNAETSSVALAINVAWGEEHLPEILKVLTEEKTKATFFLVGSWVKAFPELTKELVANGHELGNHGLYHGHPLQMKREELKRIITENESLIQSVTGKKMANIFAPPYGEISPLVVGTAGELVYQTIMWSVDSVDWKNPAPEILLNRVLSKIEAGGIILLHPTAPTKTALRELIRSLRKKGLEPGTVSKVLKQ